MAETQTLCVCVLFYGADDYSSRLAARVLNEPLLALLRRPDVEPRFGLNAVGEQTRTLVQQVAEQVDAQVTESPENVYKYPMMRHMLRAQPLRAPFTMWFDDNSYLAPTVDSDRWWGRIARQMAACGVLGSVYTQGLVGNQAEWIKVQPWFNGRVPGPYIKYPAGGWWTAQSEILTKFNWPPPNIRHHGGDVMLGALCQQHDIPLCHFRDQVLIQTNDSGVESASTPRRGFDALPVGADYAHAH